MLKKIIIVTRSMYGGGAERVIAQLAKYFDSIKIECKIITIDDEKVFYELPNGVELIPIGKKSSNKILDRLLRYKEVRNIIINENADVVLSMPEDIGIYVIPSMLMSNIPVVVSERNNPWVMPDKKITRIMRRIFYNYVDGIIFQTEEAATFFKKNIREKGVILSNPLDLDRIPNQYKGERRKEIVAAGRLVEQKNFELLIRAFAEFYKENNDYRLVIYGEGRLRTKLEEISRELLPEGKCILPGKSSNLLEEIKDAAMFVLSSDFEGVPNVLIEAMATGIPVISTDCPSGGPAVLIDNEKNGMLIPVNDKIELIKAMEKLKDPIRATMIANNALKIREELGSDRIYVKWFEYLNKYANK